MIIAVICFAALIFAVVLLRIHNNHSHKVREIQRAQACEQAQILSIEEWKRRADISMARSQRRRRDNG